LKAQTFQARNKQKQYQKTIKKTISKLCLIRKESKNCLKNRLCNVKEKYKQIRLVKIKMKNNKIHNLNKLFSKANKKYQILLVIKR
jgi:hypothetical protein